MDLGIAGKVVCVTGGNSGIGLATACSFAKEEASVIICGRDEDRLSAAVSSIHATTNRDVGAVRADLATSEGIDALGRYIEQNYTAVDVLVNNAGMGIYKGFSDVTETDLLQGMAINFFAPFLVTQRLLPLLKRSHSSCVINIAGRTGLRGAFPPGSSCTGPAKAAEIRFSIDLATELARDGIRVNCVIPGIVEIEERLRKWERSVTPPDTHDDHLMALRNAVYSKVAGPDGRSPWGKPEDIADAILFLASERASYINGATLTIDGGPHVRSYLAELLDVLKEG